jgi:hypothetical protein
MLDTLFTLWLVAQILLPFTAPFPTCDLGDLLAGTPHHSVPFTAPRVTRRVFVDSSYLYAPPLSTADGQLKLVVVSAPQKDGRGVVLAAADGARPGSNVPLQQRDAFQQTILRL